MEINKHVTLLSCNIDKITPFSLFVFRGDRVYKMDRKKVVYVPYKLKLKLFDISGEKKYFEEIGIINSDTNLIV